MKVAASKFDVKSFPVQKYDNDAAWNVEGGSAPNGVCATRWLRNIDPDYSMLTPLAAFLALAGSGVCVAGKMPHPRRECRVVVYNGQTVADASNFSDKERACWESFGDAPAKIDDWLFDIIQPNETDESYLNHQAEKMIAAGAVRITFNGHEWKC